MIIPPHRVNPTPPQQSAIARVAAHRRACHAREMTTSDSERPLDERGNPVPPPTWLGDPELPSGAALHRRIVTNPDGTTSEEVTITEEPAADQPRTER
jgi:hypothetical protein